jgi:serine/threonine protein phosphatase PrpC
MAEKLALASAVGSETGRVRQGNEDSALAGRWLFAVADGLGGHAAGEVASAAVIESLRCHDIESAMASLVETLSRAVADANAEVARRVSEDPARYGMGTTLTALLFSGDHAALAHIGDSRAFRLRDGHLRQITEDHTMGKLVCDAGLLAPVLSRYLDGRPSLAERPTRTISRTGRVTGICSRSASSLTGIRARWNSVHEMGPCPAASSRYSHPPGPGS